MFPESSTAKTKLETKNFLSFLHGFTGTRIMYTNQSKLSYYNPSCHMMDYIVHIMNTMLCDSFCFKRDTPNYHPYILRLYCGILFWIQCLRAGNDVNVLTNVQHKFLNRFLDNHPLETLPVPGPLLGLFETLCSSQPEFPPHYGKVYPRIPVQPGPAQRDAFMRDDNLESHFLANVPRIFALLKDLNRLFSQDPPVYPKRGKHIPVKENAVSTFGHKTFGLHVDRTEAEKWSLVSPGLQYPCEADQKLNEAFAERYIDFGFPVTTATDNLGKISSFLHMKRNMAWFTHVKEVANSVAAFFEGSGTFDDCSPHGMVANQVVACLSPPKHLPEPPTCIADKRATYEFSYKLRSTARNCCRVLSDAYQPPLPRDIWIENS
ncbi:unnamed protein product [Arabis nemorensis]|uniref:Uncharacterized protein n=1 Tax=Arabis nemorensis TaxID=586526 RepID=A0A565B8W9_9BRAS|nr:unnamed protein product [Arabis nemorensis]